MNKTLIKSILLRIMRLIEPHCDYYLTRSNQFYPLINPIVGIRSSQSFGFRAQDAWASGMDKVLLGLIQMLSYEILQQKIDGAIAEVGVFQGFNASVMNHFFPDRKLYLFDTFEGFDQRDLEVEERLGFDVKNYHDFSNTNIELVMSRMPHKRNVIVRKGWFPDSAADLEDEKFCFVYLDADLYQPIYEGLHWFYQRLAKGGYIVVDDYNWSDYPGAKKAVHNFSKDVGISYAPIPSATGSIVIGKPFHG